mgnify:CR=1 FL=1
MRVSKKIHAVLQKRLAWVLFDLLLSTIVCCQPTELILGFFCHINCPIFVVTPIFFIVISPPPPRIPSFKDKEATFESELTFDQGEEGGCNLWENLCFVNGVVQICTVCFENTLNFSINPQNYRYFIGVFRTEVKATDVVFVETINKFPYSPPVSIVCFSY